MDECKQTASGELPQCQRYELDPAMSSAFYLSLFPSFSVEAESGL